MSTQTAALSGPEGGARLYLACPLTGLRDVDRRQIDSDVEAVKRAVERETNLDRIPEKAWPLAVYAPIDHTAPWRDDGLSPYEVYRRNLKAIHDSDGLVVLAEKGGSAGVGQELEWAIQLRIPVLYLTATDEPSRQIAGSPAFISAQVYGNDTATLEDHVKNFLRRWRPLILDGPSRRESRGLRFQAITTRLLAAWVSCSNPTEVAAQARIDLRYLEVALSDARYVAVMATDTLLTLAQLLGVPLRTLDPEPSFVLPVPMLRPLMAAAAEEGWQDNAIERLLHEGRAALQSGSSSPLTTISGWKRLSQKLAA